MRGNRLLYLFLSFFKIGLFTFGGGYAMISLFEREFVEKSKIIEHDEFLDLVAIAESTPGPIAINVATYVGYRTSRIFGAIIATLAVCIPSVAIIFSISLFFDAFLENQIVASAFRGIQAAVVYLVLSAGVKMIRKMKKKPFNLIIVGLTVLAFVSVTVFSVAFSSIFFILIGAVIGLFAYAVSTYKSERGGGISK
jgi:chromate transporter